MEKDKPKFVEIVYKGKRIKVKTKVAEYLEECRRDLHSQSKKKRRNQDSIKCEEDFIETFMATPPVGFEDELIWRLEQERLPGLIALLPEIQRRRLTAYYYEGLSYREIAAREGVDHRAVNRSVESAIKFLKKYFE